MRHTSIVVRTALGLLLGGLLAVPATAAAATATPDPGQRQIIDLGTLGGQYTISEARAVNDRGQVVGDSIPAGLGPEHAFLWGKAGCGTSGPSAASSATPPTSTTAAR